MGAFFESGNYKNAAVTGVVSNAGTGSTPPGGSLLGYYVNSTTAGTLVLRDGGSGGTVMGGTMTPSVGWQRFPANFGAGGLHATIGGTLDVTFFYVPGG